MTANLKGTTTIPEWGVEISKKIKQLCRKKRALLADGGKARLRAQETERNQKANKKDHEKNHMKKDENEPRGDKKKHGWYNEE